MTSTGSTATNSATTPPSYGSVDDSSTPPRSPPPPPPPPQNKPNKRRSSASRRRSSSSSLTPFPSSFRYLATTTGLTTATRLIRSRNRLLAEHESSEDEDEDDESSDDIELGDHPEKPTTTAAPTTSTTTTTTTTTATTTNIWRKSEKDDHKWDDEMLQNVMANVGQCASGVVYLQLWVLNEQRNRLIQPSAGAWLDPIFHNCPHRHRRRNTTNTNSNGVEEEQEEEEVNSTNHDCPLCPLVDKKHPKYLKAEPLPIGVGLAGALWQTTAQQETTSSFSWRDLAGLANDPDQPWCPRLQHLASPECGFGFVTAVPFHILGEEGIIVCITRAKDQINLQRLTSTTNVTLLLSSAQLIGSAFLFRGPRREAAADRKAALKASLQRARLRLLALRAMGVKLSDVFHGNTATASSSVPPQAVAAFQEDCHPEKIPTGSWCHFCCPSSSTTTTTTTTATTSVSSTSMTPIAIGSLVIGRMGQTIRKFQSPNVPAPPGFDTTQTAWTFVGVFLSLTTLTHMNAYLVSTPGGLDHAFPLPPFGAFLTLLYGLTGAPASQPRNAILGQAISLSIALSFSMYGDDGDDDDESIMKPWLKQSLATSLAIALMAKFSITHPPAGAAAMIFSSSSSNMKWSNLGFMLVANVVVIGIATVVNNMSTKRQYPTSWGIPTYMSTWLEKAAATAPTTTSTTLQSRRTSLVVPNKEPPPHAQRWYHKFRTDKVIHA
jgi:hypothetical protein